SDEFPTPRIADPYLTAGEGITNHRDQAAIPGISTVLHRASLHNIYYRHTCPAGRIAPSHRQNLASVPTDAWNHDSGDVNGRPRFDPQTHRSDFGAHV